MKTWPFLLSFGLTVPAAAQSFRGLPQFVKIESVTLSPSPSDPALNLVQVCYKFGTTIPLVDYSDLATLALKGVKVKRKDADGGLINDAQTNGVQFQFTVQGFNFYAYLNSESRAFALPQLPYFNSAVRSTAGVAKPLQLMSYGVNYQTMLDPQYEWVSSCESIPFGKAYSERYVRSLFRGPGPIGNFEGTARFDFNAYLPAILGSKAIQLRFNPSAYAVPVFGTSPLEEDDQRMINLSHAVNSLNAVKENLDEKALNKYLEEHQNIVKAFEERYGIAVTLPLDTERLIAIIREVAGLKNLPTERVASPEEST